MRDLTLNRHYLESKHKIKLGDRILCNPQVFRYTFVNAAWLTEYGYLNTQLLQYAPNLQLTEEFRREGL